MSQRDLAAAIGVSGAAVALWELGRRQPGALRLAAIAAALGIAVWVLAKYAEAQRPAQ